MKLRDITLTMRDFVNIVMKRVFQGPTEHLDRVGWTRLELTHLTVNDNTKKISDLVHNTQFLLITSKLIWVCCTISWVSVCLTKHVYLPDF